VLTLLLDIDGVVAPTRPAPDSLQVTIDGADSGIIEYFRIHYRPAILAGLAELRSSGAIEIVILSTWLDMPTMLEELATAINLHYDRLLSGPYVAGWGVVEQHWKRNRAIEEITTHPDRTYVWADDEINADDRAAIRKVSPKHTLIVPNERTGLTTRHLDRIRALALIDRDP
jgi:hypothetical protein